MRADLWPLVEAGKIQLPIDRIFPLDEAPRPGAYARQRPFRKIVLRVWPLCVNDRPRGWRRRPEGDRELSTFQATP